jgi:hypothetical protein
MKIARKNSFRGGKNTESSPQRILPPLVFADFILFSMGEQRGRGVIFA